MTGIDGFGCFFEERCVQGNGKGVSRNLWKINSYEGKIEIIRRSRKENARYLDLLCPDTIWKRGREKVEPRPLADTLVLFTKFSSRFLFFLFFPPRERENRGEVEAVSNLPFFSFSFRQ